MFMMVIFFRKMIPPQAHFFPPKVSIILKQNLLETVECSRALFNSGLITSHFSTPPSKPTFVFSLLPTPPDNLLNWNFHRIKGKCVDFHLRKHFWHIELCVQIIYIHTWMLFQKVQGSSTQQLHLTTCLCCFQIKKDLAQEVQASPIYHSRMICADDMQTCT